MSELSKEARELLASLGDADGPSPAQTSRIKQRLGVGLAVGSSLLAAGGAAGAAKLGATGGAVASAGAKLGGTGIAGLMSMFVLGAAAGVGVSATTAFVRNQAQTGAPAAVSSAAPAVERSRRQFSNLRSQPVAPVAIDDQAAPPEPAPVPRSQPAVPAPAAQPEPPSSPLEPTLGPELELVILAKRELSQGRPAQALATVERLALEFPNGALREERMLLRVLSLCALGRTEPARRQAREFALAAPRSPLLPRLEQSCGGDALATPNAASKR